MVLTPSRKAGRRSERSAGHQWTARAVRPSPAGGARVNHAQVFDRRTRGYITVGLYPADSGRNLHQDGEEGSTVSGLMTPLQRRSRWRCRRRSAEGAGEKFAHTRLSLRAGPATSRLATRDLMDYIFRWLNLRFCRASNSRCSPASRPNATTARSPSILEENEREEEGSLAAASGQTGEEVARRLNQVSGGGQANTSPVAAALH